jgi:predicted NBD/HSP70 family sugar kinase
MLDDAVDPAPSDADAGADGSGTQQGALPGTQQGALPGTQQGALPGDGPVAAIPSGSGTLLQLLRDGVPRTRSELASVTGLARSTVAQRIEALLARGFLISAGEAVSTGGRPPTRFAFNPGAGLTIGADLGATHARLAVTDLAGTIITQTRADLDIALGPGPVLDWVVAHGRELLTMAGRDRAELVGVGVGLPGPVEHSAGRPVNPPIMPGWDGFDVKAYVTERLGAPTLVDNDVNIMALGEHFSAWSDARHLMFVKAATGIGCGIIVDGRVHRGAQGAAGDMGHIQVSRDERVLCRCGNTGCLEAVASGAAVAAKLTEQGIPARNSPDVVALARGGSIPALQLVRQAGRDIGEVLAAAVNLLNPSVIVLGGSLAQVGEHLIAGVREVVYQRSLPLATQHLRIASSRTGESAGVVGAAVMVIEHSLAPDRVDGNVGV